MHISALASGPVGAALTADHFGLNFVFQYERIGDRPWEKFDEVHAESGATLLRYPGGTAAETVFDIADPNATQGGIEDGLQLKPLDEFLAYCDATGAQTILTLPTAIFLSDSYSDGHRVFDPENEAVLRQFLRDVFATHFDTIHTLELGNEYESYMTSREYGRIASNLAEIVQEEIDAFVAAQPEPPVVTPDIAVQVWTHSTTGFVEYAELATRNDVVLAEFSETAIAAVDTVTTHYYYRDGRFDGQPLHQTLENLETALALTTDLLDAWTDAHGADIELMVSEWNVNHHADDTIGLRQWPYLLSMMAGFVANEVDTLTFWSAQYHPTSLANANGSLTPAGELFAFMAQNLQGLSVLPLEQSIEGAHLTGFTGDSYTYVFVSSTRDSAVSLSLSEGLMDGFALAGAHHVSVDLATSDGMFKGEGGYLPYAEPDVDLLFTGLDAGSVFGHGTQLGAYETLILVYERDGLTDRPVLSGETLTGSFLSETLIGGSGDDIFRPGTGNDVIDGGAGHDVLDLSDLADGVTIHASAGAVEHSHSTAAFTGIEHLIGTAQDDRLTAMDSIGADLGEGNDTVQIGGGSGHAIATGAGDDQVYVFGGGGSFDLGAGDDFLMALVGVTVELGAGRDHAILSTGADTLIFNDAFGHDTVTGAEAAQDQLLFQGTLADRVATGDYSIESGTGWARVSFGPDDSIRFDGMDAAALADWLVAG